ncbi:MAG: 5'-nucleotidase, lipoprotein e(P4) family [Bacteroidales bacterium]|nr:5'-nucleotidase, lipoprotein e(P4) family [Bacteroidales bacterium]MCF8334237.1 5'-nucleotidase, lipoprotein e(P4) family [Bacteroidales bacterium]
MKRVLFPFLILLLLSSCKSQDIITENQATDDNSDKNLPLLQATLYHQTASEMRALAYQAFNVAKLQVDRHMRRAGLTQKQAVVLDIDETILDNSPFQAHLIKKNASYSAYWAEWIKKEQANAIPGALEFLNYADKKGLAIFYVSNRHDSLRKHTKANLKDVGFPQVTDDHLFLKTVTSGKEKRRQRIADEYKIIMLIGDNLNDFSEVFEGKSVAGRYAKTDSLREAFGKRFIVLPNAMYGEWEGAAIDYKYDASASEKLQRKLDRLEGFEE